MSNTPAFLKDANTLLTEDGFKTSNVWYHGTSSALINSIQTDGLKRSGDKAIKEAAKKTMATIGNTYEETIEPVFLTQCKELAFYWAEQTVRNRSVRIEGNEEPIVISVTLPDELNSKVKPDVGAASLLMVKEGENFMIRLASIYAENDVNTPQIDLMRADRMDYLLKLGMAYFDNDIDARYLDVIEET